MSAIRPPVIVLVLALTGIALLPANDPVAQSIYKYRGADGRWHYGDKPPDDGRKAEQQARVVMNLSPEVKVQRVNTDDGAVLIATNEFHGPVEFSLTLTETTGVHPETETETYRVLPAAERTEVLRVAPAAAGSDFRFRYQYRYMLGDPEAEHRPTRPYRAPVAVGQSFPVTQASPGGPTHNSRSSRHAVDLAMPVGTGIYAAREGVVVAIAFTSFTGGTSAEDARKANLVRVLHEDGTLATYGHLRLESVRVRPGDRVTRGQYIADSGNTGFSTGPHLHFDISRNTGFDLESLPVVFEGPGGNPVVPAAGDRLAAY